MPFILLVILFNLFLWHREGVLLFSVERGLGLNYAKELKYAILVPPFGQTANCCVTQICFYSIKTRYNFLFIYYLFSQMGSREEKIDLDSDEEIPFSSSPTKRKVHSLDFEMDHVHTRSDVPKSRTFNFMRISLLRSIYVVLIKAKINLLLPFGPLAILLHYTSGKHVMSILNQLYEQLFIQPKIYELLASVK